MQSRLSAGFEPARENPNGFLVHRLNHSATTTIKRKTRGGLQVKGPAGIVFSKRSCNN